MRVICDNPVCKYIIILSANATRCRALHRIGKVPVLINRKTVIKIFSQKIYAVAERILVSRPALHIAFTLIRI